MAEQRQSKIQTVDTAELALKCAQFFMSLGQSCLQFYHKYNKEKERKTKIIKKAQKQKPKPGKRVEGQVQELDEDLKKKLPKKPLTAYIIYFQEKKPNFVEKHPGLNLSQLTKLIAKQWKQIDNNKKKPYLAQAQEDRKRYENEMKQFKSKYGANISGDNEEMDQQQNGQILNEGNQSSNQPQNIENQEINEARAEAEPEAEVQAEQQGDGQAQGQGEGEGQNQAEVQGQGQAQGDDNMDEQKPQNQNDQQQQNEGEGSENNEGNEGHQGSSGKKSEND